MMHRVLAATDFYAALEFHGPAPPCAGGSASILHHNPLTAKCCYTVQMGLISTNPLGMGHDAGFGRPHIMYCPPDPTGAISAAECLAATLTSSCKPMFNSHAVQIGVSGSSLPVTCETLPYYVSYLSNMNCGSPCNTPEVIPLVPTQLTVLVGMTLGDFVAGFVNSAVDALVSFGMGKLGSTVGDRLAKRFGSRAIKWVAKNIVGLFTTAAGAVGSITGTNFSTGIDNPGRILQELIDRDNVGSDAVSGVRFLGFGVEATTGERGVQDGAQFVHPFSPSPQSAVSPPSTQTGSGVEDNDGNGSGGSTD